MVGNYKMCNVSKGRVAVVKQDNKCHPDRSDKLCSYLLFRGFVSATRSNYLEIGSCRIIGV